MSLDFVSEVWDALRDHIDLNERMTAADTLVNLLIDNNYEVEEIKEAFNKPVSRKLISNEDFSL
jgi:hypothetical protein